MLNLIALTSFLAASGMFLWGFRRTLGAERLLRAALVVGLIGTFAVTAEAIRITFLPNTAMGVEMSTHHVAVWFSSVLAWVTIAGFIVWNIKLIGALTAPLIALTLLLDVFFFYAAPGGNKSVISNHWSLWIHVGSAIVGQVFAIVACSASIMLLWQNRKLKSKLVSEVPEHFPAFDALSSVLSSGVWIGFAFITLSLISGAFLALQYQGIMLEQQTKVLWAILVWSWYLTILILQSVFSYRQEKLAKLALVGLAILATSWFGLGFGRG